MNFDVHCLQKKNTLSIFINAMTIKIGQAKYSWFLKSGNSKSKMLPKKDDRCCFRDNLIAKFRDNMVQYTQLRQSEIVMFTMFLVKVVLVLKNCIFTNIW